MSNRVDQLPPKDEKLFAQVSKLYDNREYTKAVRTADTILASHPNHGETMAMKGLSLHTMGKKDGDDGGYAWVKKGISKSIKSPICWHSLALCHRSDKQYADAMKAFKMAARLDSANVSVLRDVSSLAVQLRDWDTFLDVREKMVNAKPNVRAHWLGLSAGHRMKRNFEMAAAVVDVMVMILDAGDSPIETSEVFLYQADLELLANRPHKALEILKKNDSKIVDVVGKLTIKAKALRAQGASQRAAATKVYHELIALGYAECDCLLEIAALQGAVFDAASKLPADDASRAKLVTVLKEVIEKYPKLDAARRLLLDVVPLEEFEERLVQYTIPFVRKNIPSLVSVLKSLYRDPARVAVIATVFARWEAQLAANDYSEFGGVADPTYLLWVLTFQSSHYRRTGDYAQAHKYIDLAIAHTPSVEMLYLLRAKIFHREGKAAEAAEAADVARLLDLQDKYLNGAAAKYMFRAGRIDDAEARMGLFYKTSPVNDHFLTARDSQCYWYEKECGEAELKRGDIVAALQNFLLYEKHHTDNHDTLIDFHNYTFRKGNMRPWLDVIESDDKFEHRVAFLKVCPGIVRAYMAAAREGEAAARAAHVPRPTFAPTGEADEDKQREERAKEFTLSIDLDQPLAKAHRYMDALIAHRGRDVATHRLAVEYFTLYNKPVLVCRALCALAKIGEAVEAKTLAARFEAETASTKATWPAQVTSIVDESLRAVLVA